MPRVSLRQAGLTKGSRVRLTADDGDGDRYECTGEVLSVDLSGADPALKLIGVQEAKTKRLEPGAQVFLQSDLLALKLLEKAEEEPKESKGAKAKTTLAKPERRRDNPHLRRLHPIEMTELLEQTQIRAPPLMEAIWEDPLGARVLPDPDQNAEHQECLNGDDTFKNRVVPEFLAVRDEFWADQETPPALRFYPEKLYVVDKEGSACYRECVAHLCEQKVVGVGLEGQMIGRKGSLSTVCVCSAERAVLFDAVAIGADRLMGCGREDDKVEGLRSLLEDPTVVKVMHDCRQPSDMLANRFGIRLKNVWDTLAAHANFVTWKLYAGYMPMYAHSVSNLVRAYYGVSGTHLFFPHYRRYKVVEDSAVWMRRPLPDNLEIGAVRNAAYLLDLQLATRTCMNRPFIRATESLLSVVRDGDDMEAEVRSHEPHILPQETTDCLPRLAPRRDRAVRQGYPEDDRRRIHNCVGQQDPNLIFSRDCLHQNKAHKSRTARDRRETKGAKGESWD